MRIVSLSDNEVADSRLFAENGICLYIEHGGKKILFGSGASPLFLSNAERLGVPAGNADALILPINHSDCTGGTEAAVKKSPGISIYIREAAACDCAYKEKLLRTRTGLPQSFYKSEKYNTLRFERFTEVCKDFFLVSPDRTDKPIESDRHFYIKRRGGYVADDFSEECFAVCFPKRRRDGFVLLTACSYSGVADMVKTAVRLWDAPVLSVIGGFGLCSPSGKLSVTAHEAEKTAKELSKLGTGSIYTCHNTGRKGYDIMKEILGDRLQYLRAGEELEF